MFLQSQKKGVLTEVKPLNTLTPILSAEQLLAEPKRQLMLQTIQETSKLDAKHYDTIASSLIQQVAINFQRLPEGTVYFAHPGGLLDHALSRTVAATKLLRQYILPPPHGHLSDDQKRWWYTLFSASLLRGIGTLVTDYRVKRYSFKGQLLKEWEPLFENMGQVNHHYAYEFTTQENPAFKKRLTLLMARKLMPEEGFAWIAASTDILAVWLALLDEDSGDARALGAILDRADSVVIQEEILSLPLSLMPSRRAGTGKITTFTDTTLDVPEKERIAALEFIRWIQNKIEAGHFLLNRAPVFVVPGGILICIEAFQLFSKEHVAYKNWHSVQQGLMSLNIHRTNEQGAAVSKYDQGNGMIIANSIILPEKISLKNEKTGEKMQTTATQLTIGDNAMQISKKGDWILEKHTTSPHTNPMNRPHG